MNKITYENAGVNIEAGNEVVSRIKNMVKTTFSSNIISNLGSFAALIDLKPILKNYDNPVLVQSIDGVGTKVIIARMMNKFDTLGIDLLSSSSNDILVTGATPLTLLDYIASDRLQPEIIEQMVSGMVKACCENNVSLVGGETAEMPDTYLSGENDLVGIITGVVEKSAIIDGSKIKPGDIMLGFPSSGLHTNGYSLARKLFFEVGGYNVDTVLPEFQQTLGEVLLAPHINYANPILTVLKAGIKINGMAHITGGGLLENIPRVLPKNCAAEINLNSWEKPTIFNLMQKLGKLDARDMYTTFNMGIGFVVVLDEKNAEKLIATTKDYKLKEIGMITSGKRETKLN
jgi:phosphoribosylformylglycinamidine cyclo-ligase